MKSTVHDLDNLDFEVQIIRLNCRWNCGRGFSRQNCSEVIADLGV